MLTAYELFAGRAIRRLAGRDPQLPYRSREMTTARKVVSTIGLTEICPVRCRVNDTVEPLPARIFDRDQAGATRLAVVVCILTFGRGARPDTGRKNFRL